MSTEPAPQKEKNDSLTNDPITALLGLFADGSSLTADLLAEHKKELEKDDLRILQLCADKGLDGTENQHPFLNS